MQIFLCNFQEIDHLLIRFQFDHPATQVMQITSCFLRGGRNPSTWRKPLCNNLKKTPDIDLQLQLCFTEQGALWSAWLNVPLVSWHCKIFYHRFFLTPDTTLGLAGDGEHNCSLYSMCDTLINAVGISAGLDISVLLFEKI